MYLHENALYLEKLLKKTHNLPMTLAKIELIKLWSFIDIGFSQRVITNFCVVFFGNLFLIEKKFLQKWYHPCLLLLGMSYNLVSFGL